jgi:hypothetical protein
MLRSCLLLCLAVAPGLALAQRFDRCDAPAHTSVARGAKIVNECETLYLINAPELAKRDAALEQLKAELEKTTEIKVKQSEALAVAKEEIASLKRSDGIQSESYGQLKVETLAAKALAETANQNAKEAARLATRVTWISFVSAGAIGGTAGALGGAHASGNGWVIGGTAAAGAVAGAALNYAVLKIVGAL